MWSVSQHSWTARDLDVACTHGGFAHRVGAIGTIDNPAGEMGCAVPGWRESQFDTPNSCLH